MTLYSEEVSLKNHVKGFCLEAPIMINMYLINIFWKKDSIVFNYSYCLLGFVPKTLLVLNEKNHSKIQKALLARARQRGVSKWFFMTKKSSFIISTVCTYFMTRMKFLTANIPFYSISNSNVTSLTIMKFDRSNTNK